MIASEWTDFNKASLPMKVFYIFLAFCKVSGAFAGARSDMLNAMQQLMTGEEQYFNPAWIPLLEAVLSDYNEDLPNITVSLIKK